MNELTRADIRVANDYEVARNADRRQLADLKSHRRVVIEDLVALVFENRETVRGVVEEIVRTERLRDSDEIAAEVTAFNAIVPAPGELSACLYLEAADAGDLAELARGLSGIERTVFLEVDGSRLDGRAEELVVEAGAPAMYHLVFTLSEAQRQAWLTGASVVAGCDHPACSGRTVLRDDQRESLAADFV